MSQQSDIRIDPSVLTNRTEAFSSLTDVNGTAVFTNHYEEQIEQYQQKEEASYEHTGQAVFVQSMGEDTSQETQIKQALFTGTGSQIIQQGTQAGHSGDTLLLPVTGLLLVIGVLLIIKYIQRRKGKWEKDVNNTYDYES